MPDLLLMILDAEVFAMLMMPNYIVMTSEGSSHLGKLELLVLK
jgi:hypothetical protein